LAFGAPALHPYQTAYSTGAGCVRYLPDTAGKDLFRCSDWRYLLRTRVVAGFQISIAGTKIGQFVMKIRMVPNVMGSSCPENSLLRRQSRGASCERTAFFESQNCLPSEANRVPG
jgi:hypothetical protein